VGVARHNATESRTGVEIRVFIRKRLLCKAET
jgi:hypothetical protein